MARNAGLIHEPCTLVYTLLDENIINFSDFNLIVRSLHSYMVESIVPNERLKNVHVTLNYQASLPNAQAKLGTLQSAVGVTKLSSHVKESEFAHLEQLRRQYGIGTTDPNATTSRMVQPKPRAATRGRAVRPRLFTQRPAPYQPKPAKNAPVLEETSFQEGDNAYIFADPIEEVSE